MTTSISSDFRAASAYWLDVLLESARFSSGVDIAVIETVETNPKSSIAPAETASLAFGQDRDRAMEMLRRYGDRHGDTKAKDTKAKDIEGGGSSGSSHQNSGFAPAVTSAGMAASAESDRDITADAHVSRSGSDMFAVFDCRRRDGTLVARLGFMNRTRPLSLYQHSMGDFFADMFGSIFEAQISCQRLSSAMAFERTARQTRRSLHQFYASSISSKSREEAAQLLATGASELFKQHLCLCALREGDQLRFVYGDGFRYDITKDWEVVPLDAQLPIAECVKEGSFVEVRSREQIVAQYPAMLEVSDKAEMWNVFCFPIIGAQGVIHGALAATARDVQLLDNIDRGLLLELLDYAASALDQIDALNESKRIGLELQLALLPRKLPSIDWLNLAAVYKPALETVGGDWYDVIDVSDDSVALVIGDVAGHNTRSAAIMGQVRHVVASKLARGLPPHQALIEADYYFSQIYREMLVTVCVVVLSKSSNTILVSSAGHPPPLVYNSAKDERARLLTVAPGPPIGFGKHDYSSSELPWEPNSVLALITDGVFETQGLTIEESLGWLIDELHASPEISATNLGDLYAKASRQETGTRLDDDTLVAFGSDTSRSLEPLLKRFLVAANNSRVTDDVAVLLAQRSI